MSWCLDSTGSVALVATSLEAFSKFGIDNLIPSVVVGRLCFKSSSPTLTKFREVSQGSCRGNPRSSLD